MTSATDELRRLLDERGVEYGGSDAVVYFDDRRGYKACAYCAPRRYGDGVLCICHTATPAQAIDATLGRGTCRNAMPLLSSGMPYPDSWMCSECGGRMDGIILEVGSYCPNCGRKVVDA